MHGKNHLKTVMKFRRDKRRWVQYWDECVSQCRRRQWSRRPLTITKEWTCISRKMPLLGRKFPDTNIFATLALT